MEGSFLMKIVNFSLAARSSSRISCFVFRYFFLVLFTHNEITKPFFRLQCNSAKCKWKIYHIIARPKEKENLMISIGEPQSSISNKTRFVCHFLLSCVDHSNAAEFWNILSSLCELQSFEAAWHKRRSRKSKAESFQWFFFSTSSIKHGYA